MSAPITNWEAFEKVLEKKKQRRKRRTGKYGGNYTREFKEKANLINKQSNPNKN